MIRNSKSSYLLNIIARYDLLHLSLLLEEWLDSHSVNILLLIKCNEIAILQWVLDIDHIFGAILDTRLCRFDVVILSLAVEFRLC